MKEHISIRQRDESDCGAAALCSIAAHYGVALPLSEAKRVCGCTAEGISLKGITDGADAIGFSAKAFKAKDKSISSLKSLTDPVIVHTKRADGYLHYAVLYSVGTKRVKLMDPAVGKCINVALEDFMVQWTGYIITVLPGTGFKEQRQKESNWRGLLSILKTHREEVGLATIGAIALSVIGVCNSVFLQQLIDNIIPLHQESRLLIISSIILILIPLQLYIGYAQAMYMVRGIIKTDASIVIGLMEKILKLPAQFFRSYSSGEIESRIADSSKIGTFINGGIIQLVVSVVTLGVVAFLIIILARKSATIILSFVPLFALLYWFTERFNRQFSKTMAERAAKVEEDIIDCISGADTIRHFGCAGMARKRYGKSYSTFVEKSYKGARYSSAFMVARGGITQLLLATVIISGGYAICNGTLTTGEMVSCYTLCAFLVSPIAELMNLNSTINEALTASERISDITSQSYLGSNSSVDVSDTSYLIGNTGDLIFNNVCFNYPGKGELIKDFSCTMKRGEITAVTGANGCGKSTLASLILKDLTPTSGSISLGNINQASYQSEQWLEFVAVAPQKGHLFDSTLMENITSGDEDPDTTLLAHSCAGSGVDNFLQSHPTGLLTMMGRGGASVSGGEMQKIMIARMLYKDSPIMLFDEATSFMDAGSEEQIVQLMKDLRERGKCVIAITHKEKILAVADQTIKMAG